MSYSEVTKGVWEVRWRQGGKNKSARVYSENEAIDLDFEKKRQKRTGAAPAAEPAPITFKKLSEDVWDRYAPDWAPTTRQGYAWLLDTHITPHIGGYKLADLTPLALDDWVSDMGKRNVGKVAQRKAIVLTRSILERGVEWRRLPSNPAAYLKAPKQPSVAEVVPLSPADIWKLIDFFNEKGDQQSAIFVELMGFAGLRPEEALGLPWHNVRDGSLYIEQIVTHGEIHPRTKNNKPRSVNLLAPLAADLAEYKMRLGRPTGAELLILKHGEPLGQVDYSTWRTRRFNVAVDKTGLKAAREKANLPSPTPYYLRHSFASLLLHEGMPAIKVARQMGHSMAVLDRTYAHLIPGLEASMERSAEQEVIVARKRADAA